MPIDPVRASTDSEDGGTTTRCLPTRRKKGHAGGCHTPHPPRDEENDRERKTDDGMTHLHTHMTFANLSLIYMTQNAVCIDKSHRKLYFLHMHYQFHTVKSAVVAILILWPTVLCY